MRFSIITPSFRNSDWLKLCIASVADQGVDHEHLVQDACSDDGTLDWLPSDPRVETRIEPDRGMYDGINRGLSRARGEICAYLNCDEQYLPGALVRVDEHFQRHPDLEVIFANVIVVDREGGYRCERRACRPQLYHSLVSGNLAILTAATFFRRSLLDQHHLFFDASMKSVGDGEWIARIIKQRIRMGLLPAFTSIFTVTGENLNLRPEMLEERKVLAQRAPWWARKAKPMIIAQHRLRRFLEGDYRTQAPYTYSLYTRRSPTQRVLRRADHPTYRWEG